MKNIFFLLTGILLLAACQKEAKFQMKAPEEVQLNKEFSFDIHNLNEVEASNIKVFVDNQFFKEFPYSSQLKIKLESPVKLGNHLIKVVIINKDKEIYSQEIPIELYAGIKPKVYSYKLITAYPHDPEAFTQGLEFHKDTLYEGTGLNGKSSLRKTDYKTGKIYKKIDLDKKYFGEGISILNDKIYQLTWKSGIAFQYDLNLIKINEFPYGQSKEGWGLCNDGKVLYKSDGTEKIWMINPVDFKEKDFINVYTDKHKIKKINELEWVRGKIFTNVWMKNALAVINPETGEVEAILNLSDLLKDLNPNIPHDVLNGIAYEPKSGHLFVTGKFWDKIFELEIPDEIFVSTD